MCAAPNNFNPNLGLIPPAVPPPQNLQTPALQQFGAYPAPPYPLYPGIPGYPQVPPGYPAMPIPIPLQQFPPNNANNNNDSNDDRRSSKRSRDGKDRRSHGSHRKNRSQDDYRDRKRSRSKDRDKHNDKNPNSRPVHTVFYCNIAFDCSNEEFREFASKFGEISDIYSKISDKGIAFVTYNDLRDAQKAVFTADVSLHDRKVKRAFAYKPPEHSGKNPCDTCSTVLVTSLEDVSKIKADDVIGKMREFGEIRSTSQDRPRTGEFVIKFFKLSDAKNCVDHNGLDLRHETLKIEYLPDEDAGEDPDVAKGKRNESKYRSDSDDSDDYSDSDNDRNSKQQQQQQQLQQQQILQMQMQLQQQYQQMQLQQMQQFQGQFAPPPIPPPPPLTAPPSAAPAQPAQPTAFPPYGF